MRGNVSDHSKNFKKSLVIIIPIIVILIILFTNIDDLVSSEIDDVSYQIETSVSQIEITADIESLNPMKTYSINTKCEFYESLLYPSSHYKTDERETEIESVVGKKNAEDWTPEEAAQISKIAQRYREEFKERSQQIQQKYNDRVYDYHIQNGIKWWDEPGREYYTAEDEKFLRENKALETLETYDANPKLRMKLGDFSTWGPPFVLTKQDVRDDPECVERVRNSPMSSNFILGNK